MFMLNNFYCDRKIIIDNQYYLYYYVNFKLYLPMYFLSDYCNIILRLYFTLKLNKISDLTN